MQTGNEERVCAVLQDQVQSSPATSQVRQDFPMHHEARTMSISMCSTQKCTLNWMLSYGQLNGSTIHPALTQDAAREFGLRRHHYGLLGHIFETGRRMVNQT